MIVSVRWGALLPSPGLPRIKKFILGGRFSLSPDEFIARKITSLMEPDFLTVKEWSLWKDDLRVWEIVIFATAKIASKTMIEIRIILSSFFIGKSINVYYTVIAFVGYTYIFIMFYLTIIYFYFLQWYNKYKIILMYSKF